MRAYRPAAGPGQMPVRSNAKSKRRAAGAKGKTRPRVPPWEKPAGSSASTASRASGALLTLRIDQ